MMLLAFSSVHIVILCMYLSLDFHQESQAISYQILIKFELIITEKGYRLFIQL